MIFTEWKKIDNGVWQSEVKFEASLPPFALLRAVYTGEKKWESIVRECQTERKSMIGSRGQYNTLLEAASNAYDLFKAIIKVDSLPDWGAIDKT